MITNCRWLRYLCAAPSAKKLRRIIKFIQLCERSPELFQVKTNQIAWRLNDYIIIRESFVCFDFHWVSVPQIYLYGNHKISVTNRPVAKIARAFLRPVAKSAKWKSTFKELRNLGQSAILINPSDFSSLVPRLFGQFRNFHPSGFPTKIREFFVAYMK